MPNLDYNVATTDRLHFFVYNTHNLYIYNLTNYSYRSYVVSMKIPANFMSCETADGRIFITGGGEPGKANRTCHEFVDEQLVARKSMIFERRAHTLTEVHYDENACECWLL